MKAKAKYEIVAELRDVRGKGASRRLRREENKVPGILYGGGEDPTPIMLDHLKMLHALENEGFYSHLLNLTLEGKKQQVVLKDLHRHHYKKAILHMDFLRVKPTDTIQMKVPLHFLGEQEAPGVKDSGGIVNHRLIDVEVRCQAQALPEYIEVDLSKMALDQTLHISDLKLPKGSESVALLHGHDYPVVSIHLPRAAIEEIEAPAVEAEGEEAEGETAETKAEGGKPAAGAPAAGKGGEAGKGAPAGKAQAATQGAPAAKGAAGGKDAGKGKGK